MESMAESKSIYVPVMLPATFVQPSEQNTEPVIIGEPLVNGYTTVLKCIMDPSVFKELIKSVQALTPEARMHITNDGIWIRAVDNANVAMIDLNYNKASFEMFKVIGDHTIGIDFNIWSKFLKNVKKGNLVSFELVQKELPLKPLTDDQKKSNVDPRITEYEYNFTIASNGNILSGKILDPYTIRRDPNLPAIELKTKIDLYASDFIDTIKSAHDVSDKIVFIYKELPSEPIFKAIAEGDTSKSVKEINTIAISGERARSLFSLEYLMDIAKAIQDKKEIITVSMDNDHPIKITLSNDNRSIVYLLAPRIEAD